jgi:hypothetical protein
VVIEFLNLVLGYDSGPNESSVRFWQTVRLSCVSSRAILCRCGIVFGEFAVGCFCVLGGVLRVFPRLAYTLPFASAAVALVAVGCFCWIVVVSPRLFRHQHPARTWILTWSLIRVRLAPTLSAFPAQHVKAALVKQFRGSLSQEEIASNYMLRERMDIYKLFHRIQQLTGVKLTKQV